MTWLHVSAGLVGLVSGAVALFVRKGTKRHRYVGTVFIYSMMVMAASGTLMAVIALKELSVIAGTLTFYLVFTAVLTVRRPGVHRRQVDIIALLVVLAVAVAGTLFGLVALHSATGQKDGFPPAPYFLFGAVAWLAFLLDLRMLWVGGLTGSHRLARHLWRMCFALFIAAASFFLGQMQVFPEAVRRVEYLGLPVLIVLLLMLVWLARVFLVKRYQRV